MFKSNFAEEGKALLQHVEFQKPCNFAIQHNHFLHMLSFLAYTVTFS